MQKAPLRFGQIWNMCFGFLGIQIGFELQAANTSRIFQTLGADIDSLAILWIAAPLTGLLVQPLIGYLSDKTWTPLGRRRPYFLVGAILASASLIVMPNSPFLWVAAGMLWIKDAALNTTMEPFRAFVADNLPEKQRPTGYALQSFFIGVGAVGAAALPWVLTNWFQVPNTAEPGHIPPSVHIAYYVGAVSLFGAVLWTVLRSREYSPEELDAFERARREALGIRASDVDDAPIASQVYLRSGATWIVAGAIAALFVWYMRAFDDTNIIEATLNLQLDVKQDLYVLAGLIAGYGVVQVIAGLMSARDAAGASRQGLVEIVEDLFRMPTIMRQLAVVQFFSWFAMFAMWIYAVPALSGHHFASPDPASQGYQDAADWWGVLSAVRNGIAALGAFVIIWLARSLDLRRVHALNLSVGAIGFLAMYVIRDPSLLWAPMIGIGVAWASIVSVPYSILSSAVPARKMGVYMGIFNIFIVVPQLIAATLLGFLLANIFGSEPVFALVLAGMSLVMAAIAALFVGAPAGQPALEPGRASERN